MKPGLATGRRAALRHYLLDQQVGFLLRQVSQRHATIFATRMDDEITPTQWAALAKLHEAGPTSQNLLGRLTAMDAATIKGVIDRLFKRGFVLAAADAGDARRRLLDLSETGRAFVLKHVTIALAITEDTLAPLSEREQTAFIDLLRKLR